MQAEMTRTAASRPAEAYRMDRRGIMAQGRQQSSASRQRCAMPAASAAPAETTPKAVCTQLEQLNRKLAAAHAEIRRYQTKLFACERQMAALRQENAELEAACAEAQEEAVRAAEQVQQLQEAANGMQPVSRPELPQAEEPEAPESKEEAQPEPPVQAEETPQAEPACEPQPPAQPEWQPKTKLDHLSVELMHWFDDMMGA